MKYYSDEIIDLRNELSDFETRLERHFEHLNEVATARDRLALDAAWGVLSGVNKLIACLSPLLLGSMAFHLDGWKLTVFWIVGWAILSFVFSKSYWKGWQGDISKMGDLPEWDRRDWYRS